MMLLGAITRADVFGLLLLGIAIVSFVVWIVRKEKGTTRGQLKIRIERMRAEMDDAREVALKEKDNLHEAATAYEILLEHERLEELTDGALRRALRTAIEIERHLDDEGLGRPDSWGSAADEIKWGIVARNLARDLLMRLLARDRPSTLEEAEGRLLEIVDEYGVRERDADALKTALLEAWPEIEGEYARVDDQFHMYGSREELRAERQQHEERELLDLDRQGAVSPRSVLDLKREVRKWFYSSVPEPLERIEERMHARAEEVGLDTGDVTILDEWLTFVWTPPTSEESDG
jgi:hypothetical protein